ncbi:hypothetical protein F5Y15DRAFT_242872 [Xylariaceae sp. FL0016]|nr:hypothetical protein F5Y15DRAFT_242872 [Xylariaceae sp. FL0016]
MSSSAAGPHSTAPKHRACDECRTRKLACTKEPDGCSRCKRESIVCHYSPQKPMGRPRKRPRDETTHASALTAPSCKTSMTELPPDTADPGMDFINLLLGEDFSFDMPMQPEIEAQPDTSPAWSSYTPLGDVNFEPVPVDASQSFSPANIDPALFIAPANTAPSPPAPEQVPSLSPNSASTPESNASLHTASMPSCACTAELYLALASMQKLSSEVETAIREARMAAKTAYQVVNCPQCGSKIELPVGMHSTQMLHHFQNLMLLATLIPSIVHAYERILGVVDREANVAAQERRRIVFRFYSLGGMWGQSSEEDDKLCGAADAFGHREMEPAMWRLTVRALLKVDVYGISGTCSSRSSSSSAMHLGLKDIVLMMENKSQTRHAIMDALIAAGAWQPPQHCTLLATNKPGEPPQCQRIIQIARSSIDQLIIA